MVLTPSILGIRCPRCSLVRGENHSKRVCAFARELGLTEINAAALANRAWRDYLVERRLPSVDVPEDDPIDPATVVPITIVPLWIWLTYRAASRTYLLDRPAAMLERLGPLEREIAVNLWAAVGGSEGVRAARRWIAARLDLWRSGAESP